MHKNTRLTRLCNNQCCYSKYSNCQPSCNLVPRVLSPLQWRDDKVLIICKEKCASASRYLILYYFICYNIRACQRRNLRQRSPENYAWINTWKYIVIQQILHIVNRLFFNIPFFMLYYIEWLPEDFIFNKFDKLYTVL